MRLHIDLGIDQAVAPTTPDFLARAAILPRLNTMPTPVAPKRLGEDNETAAALLLDAFGPLAMPGADQLIDWPAPDAAGVFARLTTWADPA